MECRKLYIIGAGGHGKVVAELIKSTDEKIEAFYDNAPKSDYLDLIPIFDESNIVNPSSKSALIIAVGDNQIRKSISLRFGNYVFFSSIHKMAFVSSSAILGNGSVIMVHAIVNAGAEIGNHVIINSAAIIEHDCIIEDFVHISSNVTLSGNIKIGSGSHLGAGVVVIPGVKIGKWCTIGAGTVVIRDVPDGATVVGNPGKIVKVNDISKIISTTAEICDEHLLVKLH